MSRLRLNHILIRLVNNASQDISHEPSGDSTGEDCKEISEAREIIRDHLAEMPKLAYPPKADLSRGYTVSQVAKKHGWTEPMVLSLERFHAGVVSAMQKKRILRVTSRYVIVLKQ